MLCGKDEPAFRQSEIENGCCQCLYRLSERTQEVQRNMMGAPRPAAGV
jgi:hypothetical protein